MKITAFLCDKLVFILAVLATAGSGSFILYAIDFPTTAILLLNLIYLLGSLAALFCEYFVKRTYYQELFSVLDRLDKKYYVSEVIGPCKFAEGRILAEMLKITGKSMNDELSAERRANREYREYVELWVHEIKTPISAIKLICDNNGYTNISEEADKVDRHVEQALFYARAGSVEKDYIIKQISLKKLIGEVLKKNAPYLIANGIRVNLNTDGKVYADSKWLMFILQQLIDNSIKYGATTLSFAFAGNTLSVKDDGIGILARDLPRIFERGFTGENGRGSTKSTGMGLYLCKELCEKLGLTISAASISGTEFFITFPQNPYVTLL